MFMVSPPESKDKKPKFNRWADRIIKPSSTFLKNNTSNKQSGTITKSFVDSIVVTNLDQTLKHKEIIDCESQKDKKPPDKINSVNELISVNDVKDDDNNDTNDKTKELTLDKSKLLKLKETIKKKDGILSPKGIIKRSPLSSIKNKNKKSKGKVLTNGIESPVRIQNIVKCDDQHRSGAGDLKDVTDTVVQNGDTQSTDSKKRDIDVDNDRLTDDEVEEHSRLTDDEVEDIVEDIMKMGHTCDLTEFNVQNEEENHSESDNNYKNDEVSKDSFDVKR
eukprot:UN32132